jgi:hypothetical protein
MGRGPAGLSSALTGLTNIVCARILDGLRCCANGDGTSAMTTGGFPPAVKPPADVASCFPCARGQRLFPTFAFGQKLSRSRRHFPPHATYISRRGRRR